MSAYTDMMDHERGENIRSLLRLLNKELDYFSENH
jgi:hypothetical protein